MSKHFRRTTYFHKYYIRVCIQNKNILLFLFSKKLSLHPWHCNIMKRDLGKNFKCQDEECEII